MHNPSINISLAKKIVVIIIFIYYILNNYQNIDKTVV